MYGEVRLQLPLAMSGEREQHTNKTTVRFVYRKPTGAKEMVDQVGGEHSRSG